ncbi:hypothetical protein PAESOLCIP111_04244 [Paenibacillus solanacearum]|uniref:Copper chaperone NosL n=1 Tax=Paenibacillus solanacearum TaxID=2048548 RepID=A0A916K6Y3_9BACL|nr:hypothetical protein [Paenibacillus solanacearum]CAG7641550.1 hypothetical protein PAESOLCIP111_04244 [Paenibacillus solanacearum]
MTRKVPVSFTIPLYLAAFLLAASIFFPWWGMTFVAPQYPEGLEIIVYPYKMDGRIDIINGLNHYIGMKPFSEASFPELRYLPYLIGGMAALVLLAAIIRGKGWLYGIIALFAAGGIAGLYDIHRWLYNFGTELSPTAPIKIKPFVPPILGRNQIANFVTHSYFSYGSIMIGVAFLLMALSLVLMERHARRRPS